MFKDLKEKFNIEKENIILPDIQEFYINKNNITQVLEYLKNSNENLFERLDCIIAKDSKEYYTLTYILNSEEYNIKCAVSCILTYSEAEVVSIENIYKNANWEEREIYDLFGIKFINHPDLKRILLPNDFKGHPLRKNYLMQDERLSWNYE